MHPREKQLELKVTAISRKQRASRRPYTLHQVITQCSRRSSKLLMLGSEIVCLVDFLILLTRLLQASCATYIIYHTRKQTQQTSTPSSQTNPTPRHHEQRLESGHYPPLVSQHIKNTITPPIGLDYPHPRPTDPKQLDGNPCPRRSPFPNLPLVFPHRQKLPPVPSAQHNGVKSWTPYGVTFFHTPL
jgi:hypothetical protein